MVEDVKWKKPSKSAGVPVWSHDGMIYFADTLKHAVRLTFPKERSYRILSSSSTRASIATLCAPLMSTKVTRSMRRHYRHSSAKLCGCISQKHDKPSGSLRANLHNDRFDRLFSTYCTDGLIGLSVR